MSDNAKIIVASIVIGVCVYVGIRRHHTEISRRSIEKVLKERATISDIDAGKNYEK